MVSCAEAKKRHDLALLHRRRTLRDVLGAVAGFMYVQTCTSKGMIWRIGPVVFMPWTLFVALDAQEQNKFWRVFRKRSNRMA